MTSWANYTLSSLDVTDFPGDAREKALHAAQMDYTGDTNLQNGLKRITGSGALQEYNGGSWTAVVLSTANIPSLAASQITSGTLGVDRIPSLPASRISSGVLNVARVPTIMNFPLTWRGGNERFFIKSELTEDTWESVGYTGSGATNIWSAIPTDATAVLIKFHGLIDGDSVTSSSAGLRRLRVYLRANSTSNIAIAADNAVLDLTLYAQANDEYYLPQVNEVWVPLNNGRFDLYWEEVNIDAAASTSLQANIVAYTETTIG